MGLVNCLLHFVRVYQSAGALLFSNLILAVIEDYIPHCMPTICQQNGRCLTDISYTMYRLGYSMYVSKGALVGCLTV